MSKKIDKFIEKLADKLAENENYELIRHSFAGSYPVSMDRLLKESNEQGLRDDKDNFFRPSHIGVYLEGKVVYTYEDFEKDYEEPTNDNIAEVKEDHPVLKEFNDMLSKGRMATFEINLQEYGITENEEYEYANISCNNNEIFINGTNIKVELDEDLSLDLHIESLFDKWITSVKEQHNNNDSDNEISPSM